MTRSEHNFTIGEAIENLPAVERPVTVGLTADMFLIAGPCVIETRDLCLEIAEKLVNVTSKIGVGLIFKASFDKANRSSISSYRGPGLEKGLSVLAEVRARLGIPVMTDVHETHQVQPVSSVVDCLQVPAFLSRQTDLLCACAKTNRAVNVKKGQFLSPLEMANVVEKIRSCGNRKILLTERGTFFGYNRLVNDMTAIKTMQQFDCPVVFDATHSTQQPGGLGHASGGQREIAPVLARAAIAAGANGLFLEVHPQPERAKSDAATVMPLDWIEQTLLTCKKIFDIVHNG